MSLPDNSESWRRLSFTHAITAYSPEDTHRLAMQVGDDDL